MPSSPSPSLKQTLHQTLHRRHITSQIRILSLPPPNTIDFSSNDFLSLSSNPSLLQSYTQTLNSTLTHLGSGGSRLLDGNSPLATTLETTISNFHNASTGLLCNSGFDANVGIFSCLPQKDDYIVYDEYIHASVHDGMRLSRSPRSHRIPFSHNDITSLERILRKIKDEDEGVRNGSRNVFLALETVYSMDGDIAPLQSITTLVSTLFSETNNAHMIVDEAHSTGIFGSKGQGLVCELGLEKHFLIRLHTFGKALAASGAIILVNEAVVREYLVNYARPLIYTTFMGMPSLVGIRVAYEFLEQGQTVGLARKLKEMISVMYLRLGEMQEGLGLREKGLEWLLQVPGECPLSPIFAVRTSEPKQLAKWCQGRGFMVRGIVPPTVPAGTERVRVCLHAGNTVGEIEGLVEAMRKWVEMRVRELSVPSEMRARL